MPTFANTTSQESIKVFLNSKNANVVLNSSSWIFFLKDRINVSYGNHIKLSLLDIEIPFSFYQTNSSNNILTGSVGGQSYNFTIPVGNYTATELAATITTLFTGASITCSVTYDKKTNNMTFTAGSNVTITLSSASTLLQQIGFSSIGVLSGTTTLSSSQSVNVSPLRVLYVKCNNLSVNNRYNNTTSNVIANVPLETSRNGITFYKAHSNISSEVYDEKIDLLSISIVDENDDPVDFRGVDITLSLGFVFDTIKAVEKQRPSIVKDLEDLYEGA